jgi:hypothetical protein
MSKPPISFEYRLTREHYKCNDFEYILEREEPGRVLLLCKELGVAACYIVAELQGDVDMHSIRVAAFKEIRKHQERRNNVKA